MFSPNTLAQPIEHQLSGPSQLTLLWNLMFKWKNPLETITQLHQTYGPMAQIQVANRTTYLVNDADLIKRIFQDNNRNYIKRPLGTIPNPLLRNGLLTSEGEFWRRQRRLAQPAFHRKQIEWLTETMISSTEQRLNEWEVWASSDQAFDLAEEMMMLTLDIVTKTLFGSTLSQDEMLTIARLMPKVLRGTRQHAIRSRWIGEAPLHPRNRQYQHQIHQLDQIVMRLIQERIDSGMDQPDLLGMLLSTEDAETGAKMTKDQLRDEVMTLFLAGHETTANLMAWCWSILAVDTTNREAVRYEIDSSLNGRPPTLSDLPKLPFTQMVLKESMRLFPPAWILVRSPLEPEQWGNHVLEPGNQIMICTYTLHRSPEYWTNPETFDPYRFSDSVGLPHRFAYIPFGAGPRLCIGQQFAMLEATIILAMMMQRYHVTLAPDGPSIVPETAVTLRPKHGVWVQVNQR